MECENEVHFYDLAKQAKARLRKNNYNVISKDKIINNSRAFSNYISQKRVQASAKKVEKPKETEDELYKKVCKIIESNHVVNPILELIDKQLFDTLSCEAKQIYINNLTQKFKFLRTRYYKERYNKAN